MSLNKSLRVAAGLVRKRNVLKRDERLARLTETGRWQEEKDSIFHLPKTRIAIAKSLGKKKKKAKKEEDAKDAKKAEAPKAKGK